MMTHMLLNQWLVILLVLGTCPANGQSLLLGRVLDADTAEPLLGAAVYCVGTPARGVSSDLDGAFRLQVVRPDTLVVAYVGYQVRRLFLSENGRGELVVELSPDITPIDLVEVAAGPLIAREFNTRSISKLDIYTNPSAKADPLLAVQSLPSETSSEETANISLRGSSPSETTILFNNVPVRDAVKLDQANGLGQFSIFNTALVSKVEVFTSNPPLEFGASTSGVVALFSNPRVGENNYSVTLSAAGVGGYAARRLSKTTGLTAYANLSTHHLLRGMNRRSLKSIRSFTTSDGGVYLTADLKKAGQLRFFNYTLYESYQYALQEPTFAGTFDQFKLKNQSILNWWLPLKSGRLEINQGFNASNGKYEAGNFRNDLQNQDYYIDLSYRYIDAGWSFKAGMAYTHNRLKLEAVFPTYAHAFGSDYPAFPYEERSHLKVPEVFLYGKRYFGDNWTLGAGVRYHPRMRGGEPYLSWQGNLNFAPDQRHSWILSAGRYYKWVPPGLDFSRSTIVRSHHLALDYRFNSEPWSIQAAIYRKRSDWEEVKNAIQGVECFAGFSGSALSIGLSLASVSSLYKTAEGVYPTPYDFGHYLRMLVKYDIPGWFEISTVVRHRQGRYFQPLAGAVFDEHTGTFLPEFSPVNQGGRLPAYRAWDLSLSRMVGLGDTGLIVFASLNNVLDFKNVRRYTYNFDYSRAMEEYYNRRVVFLGGVWSFK